MRTLWTSLTLALGALWVASCGGNTHESLMQDTVDTMNEIGQVCEGVKDKASAEAAVDQVKTLATKLKGIIEAGKKLGEPSKELQDKFKDQLSKASQHMMKGMAHLTPYPEAAKAIQKVMSEMK